MPPSDPPEAPDIHTAMATRKTSHNRALGVEAAAAALQRARKSAVGRQWAPPKGIRPLLARSNSRSTARRRTPSTTQTATASRSTAAASFVLSAAACAHPSRRGQSCRPSSPQRRRRHWLHAHSPTSPLSGSCRCRRPHCCRQCRSCRRRPTIGVAVAARGAHCAPWRSTRAARAACAPPYRLRGCHDAARPHVTSRGNCAPWDDV